MYALPWKKYLQIAFPFAFATLCVGIGELHSLFQINIKR